MPMSISMIVLSSQFAGFRVLRIVPGRPGTISPDHGRPQVRHSCGSQVLLGHSKLDTTARYSPLRQRMLEDMNMRRFVPDTQREYIRGAAARQ